MPISTAGRFVFSFILHRVALSAARVAPGKPLRSPGQLAWVSEPELNSGVAQALRGQIGVADEGVLGCEFAPSRPARVHDHATGPRRDGTRSLASSPPAFPHPGQLARHESKMDDPRPPGRARHRDAAVVAPRGASGIRAGPDSSSLASAGGSTTVAPPARNDVSRLVER
ncbi:hypothetical protein G3I59_27675 [Amycolatopsis rubida]|uniref:Uncharacterized protein n=1 Tax=Amycolatopsis rubida TaxID=112413 RepID=A0ABX0BUM4_9PSEU|nr:MULTISPECIES: hypothetical protein [Amycolatopsis]MYW94276.1 hypothetical protein [Amycolatopsis rubida]NEC59265.1 hypothetical protein [Amycolatopsis rubida]OAP21351.1 hypothetical protein A4R44_07869 [Amycolatopsis sp. M39]